MDWPEVTILLCTYNRPYELRKTIEALLDNLHYPLHSLHWTICDDRSSAINWERFAYGIEVDYGLQVGVVQTERERSGWGRNVNNGLASVKTPYVYFSEDDYILSTRLDLRVGVALMETNKHIGYLRYRGTQGDSGVVFQQAEVDIQPWISDFQQAFGLSGKLTYFLMDGGSQSLWLYTNGPHLKHRRFHAHYGLYREGLKLGATEEAFCHQVKDAMRDDPTAAPSLAILPEFVPMVYDHIGHSYQHTEAD